MASCFFSCSGRREIFFFLFVCLFTKLFFFCCHCKCCYFVSTFCSLRCRLSGQTAGAAGERNKRVRGREIQSKSPHQFTQKSSLTVSPLLTLLTQRLYMSVKPPHVLMNQSPAPPKHPDSMCLL